MERRRLLERARRERPVLALGVRLAGLPEAVGARVRGRGAGRRGVGKLQGHGAMGRRRTAAPRRGIEGHSVGGGDRGDAPKWPGRTGQFSSADARSRIALRRGAPVRLARRARARASASALAASPCPSYSTARLWAARKLPRPRTVSLSCGCSPISSARSQLASIIGSSSAARAGVATAKSSSRSPSVKKKSGEPCQRGISASARASAGLEAAELLEREERAQDEVVAPRGARRRRRPARARSAAAPSSKRERSSRSLPSW